MDGTFIVLITPHVHSHGLFFLNCISLCVVLNDGKLKALDSHRNTISARAHRCESAPR